MPFDRDFVSMQEARDLAVAARDAQRIWAKATQADVDRVCEAMANAAFEASERLGRMAAEETGYGVPNHKTLKNQFASKNVWESIRDIKTVGVVGHDPDRRIFEIAWPMGVVVALTPSTNPTSTVMFKILAAVKARDAVIIAPHPSAARCSLETVRTMALAEFDQVGFKAFFHPKTTVICTDRNNWFVFLNWFLNRLRKIVRIR